MQQLRRLLTVALILTVLFIIPVSSVWAQGGTEVKHTVQAGENLYRIAQRYGSTITAIAQANGITNPNLIFVGQILTIPGEQNPVPTPVPTGTVTTTPPTPIVTPPPGGEIVHVVAAGENLFRISLKYGLQTSVVAAYNGIANPNLIYVGQRIRIPAGGTAGQVPPVSTPVPAGTQAPAPTAAPGTPAPMPTPSNTATNVGFAYGLQVHLPNQTMATVINGATDLGVTWLKQQIEWSLYEPTAGNVNWVPIDEMVAAMETADANILLTVNSAPGWARNSSQEKGPPTDYTTYANFVGQLAQRYRGRVQAYEIWNEQNLRREWNTTRGISAASYVEMLRLAYNAIKLSDPGAIVVTGGLAPTGFNDGVNAIDDRVYLRQMYAAGAEDYSDAIGAHPNGWANPPDSTCCRNNRPAVPGWDEHPSFFFKETLSDYREIMVQNGDSGTYIWPTEFGWGSNDGLNVQPPAEYGFVAYTSLDEQSSYLTRAFQLGREWGFVGPMFLWNLNFCQVVGVTGEQCYWSLLDPAGNPRPAYLALRDMQK